MFAVLCNIYIYAMYAIHIMSNSVLTSSLMNRGDIIITRCVVGKDGDDDVDDVL